MHDVLYLVCLCGGAQGKRGLLHTKQRRTPDQTNICIRMLPINNKDLKTTPGNVWYLVPRLFFARDVIPGA